MLRTGDLSGQRDFIWLADTVRVLASLGWHEGAVGRAIPICTGWATRMDTLVEALIRASRLQVSVEVEATRRGVSAVDVMVGDPKSLAQLGLTMPVPDIAACVTAIWDAERSLGVALPEDCVVGHQVTFAPDSRVSGDLPR